MKIYKLNELAELSPERLFNLDFDNPGGLSLQYVKLSGNEQGRTITEPDSSNGFIYIVKGELKVTEGTCSFTVTTGEAFGTSCGSIFKVDNLDEKESICLVACIKNIKETQKPAS